VAVRLYPAAYSPSCRERSFGRSLDDRRTSAAWISTKPGDALPDAERSGAQRFSASKNAPAGDFGENTGATAEGRRALKSAKAKLRELFMN